MILTSLLFFLQLFLFTSKPSALIILLFSFSHIFISAELQISRHLRWVVHVYIRILGIAHMLPVVLCLLSHLIMFFVFEEEVREQVSTYFCLYLFILTFVYWAFLNLFWTFVLILFFGLRFFVFCIFWVLLSILI